MVVMFSQRLSPLEHTVQLANVMTKTLRFYSANFADLGIIEVDLANLVFDTKDSWTNYPKGVIKFLQEAGYTINTGFDLYVNGNIPNGSGLSSSASLELLVGIVAEELF